MSAPKRFAREGRRTGSEDRTGRPARRGAPTGSGTAARGARSERPAPRGERPAPRGERPAPRGERPAPRGESLPKPKPKKRSREAERRRATKSTTGEVAKTVATSLTGKAARHLRSLGHHLDPVIHIGKEGLTEGIVAATREALLAHELIKIRILQDAPIDRNVAGEELAAHVGAAVAQTLGRTVLLYKRHPNKPKLVLPR